MKLEESGYLRLEKGRVEGYKESELIPLKINATLIGRPPTKSDVNFPLPDVKIGDDYVSRGHVKIYYDLANGVFLLEERKSGTPHHTFINGRQIEPGKPYPLKDGYEIGIAKVNNEYRVVFRFRQSGEAGIKTLLGLDEVDKPLPGVGELKIDVDARRVWLNGEEIQLRKKEFDLLAYLYQRLGKACSRYEIAMNVWKGEKAGEIDGIVTEETIDTTVYRIRQAIEEEPNNPRMLLPFVIMDLDLIYSANSRQKHK